jgi:TonB family protein
MAGGAAAWSLMRDRAQDGASPGAQAENEAQRDELELRTLEADVLEAEPHDQVGALDDLVAPREPAVAPNPDRLAAGDASLLSRRAEDVRRVIVSVEPDTRRCYKAELRRNPSATGRVDATLVIEPSGRVSNVQTRQSGTLSAEVARCVAQVLRAARFEPAGDSTTVNMPYSFSS